MAKKDDFDLDDFDDLGDFGDPPMQDTQSRNPVLETASIARRSALAAIWPKHKREEVILKGMPDQAEDAWKGYKDVKDVMGDVASHTKTEVEKTARILKIQARQLTPTMRKYLPDALVGKIENWAKSDDQYQQNYDPNQLLMDREMGQIFGTGNITQYQDPRQARKAQKEAQEETTSKKIEQTVDRMKFDALLDSNIQIAKSVHSMSQISTGLSIEAQKKSIEIGYRTLFAVQDLVKINKTIMDRSIPAIEAIVKNTALPDYAKENFGEIRGAQMKRKLAEWINPLQYADGFLDQIRNNTKDRVTEMFEVARSMIEGGGSMMQDDDYFSDSREASPEQRAKNARKKAMETMFKFIGDKTLVPIRDKGLAKSKEWMEQNPEIMKFLQGAKYNLRNLSSISNSGVSGERNDFMGNMFETMAMLGLVDPYRRERVGLESRDGETLSQAAKIDKKFVMTVVEIIPAWLKQIDSSVRKGYGDGTSIEYDIHSRGMITAKEMGNRVRKLVANDPRRGRIRNNIDEIVSFIDDGSLTEKDREGLSGFVESRLGTGKEFNVGQLIEDPSILYQHMKADGVERLQKILGNKAGADIGGHYAVSNEIAARMKNAQASYGSYQDMVNEMATVYGERALRQSGIFKYNRGDDTFGVDKDLVNPLVDFGSLDSGKTLYGRARIMDEAIKRKMANADSASGHYLRRKYGKSIDEGDDYDPLAGIDPVIGPQPGGGGGRGGLTAFQLRDVLYGRGNNTNLVEVLKNRDGDGKSGDCCDRLVAAINAANSKSILHEIMENVVEMNRVGVSIADGDDDYDEREVDDDVEAAAGESKKKRKKRRRRKRNKDGKRGFFGSSWDALTSLTGGAYRRGKTTMKWGWRQGRGFRSKMGARLGGMASKLNPFNLMGNVASGVGMVGSGVKSFGKHLTGSYDIYNEQGEVVLQGRKLSRGEYYQLKNGRLTPIDSIDKIDYDLDILNGDSTVAVSKEDLKAKGKLTYFRDGRWYNVFEKLGVAAGTVGRKALSIPSRIMKAVSSPIKAAGDWAFNLPDMYVRGETTPRLRANIMRAGGYFDKASGKNIRTPDDVVGAVIDKQGNVVITDEEVANPEFKLVDLYGRDVKSPFNRVTSRIKKLFTSSVHFVAGLPGRAMDGLRNIRDWARGERPERQKGGVSSIFANNAFGASKRTNTILLRIYKLLNSRMPGEPEDESWATAMDENTIGASVARGARAAKALLRRRARRMKSSATKKAEELKSAYEQRGGWRGFRNKGKGWFNRLRGNVAYHGDGFVGPMMPEMDPRDFVGPMPSAGNRFRAGWRNLRGRAESLRGMMPGGFVGPQQPFGARAKHRFNSFMGDRNPFTGEFATRMKGRASSAWDKAKTLNPFSDHGFVGPKNLSERERHYAGFEGPVKPGSTDDLMTKRYRGKPESMSDKLSRLVSLAEITWFDKMRTSAEAAGMPEGRLRGMFNKFSKRSEFSDKSEKSDYLKFFRRRKRTKDSEATGPLGELAGAGGPDGKKKGLLGTIGGLIGGAVMTTLGYLGDKFSGGILKGVGGLLKDGIKGLGGLLIKQLPKLLLRVGGAALGLPGLIIGLGAYAAYKEFTAEKPTTLEKVRIAQMGRLTQDWKSDEGAQILFLEDKLGKYITYNGLGQATLRNLSAKDVEALANGYGIESEDKARMLSFHAYITQRFIPIFLRWKTAIAQLELKWEDMSSYKWKKSKLDALYNRVKTTETDPAIQALTDPRAVNNSAWTDAWRMITFEADEYASPQAVIMVQEAFERVKNINYSYIKEDEKEETQSSFYEKEGGIDRTVKSIATTEMATALNARSGEDLVAGINKGLMDVFSGVDGVTRADDKQKAPEGMVDRMDIDPKNLSLLESVRMKAYGLIKLDQGTVATLLTLEREVYTGINLKTGAWTGDSEKVFTIVSPVAFSITDEPEEKRREIIGRWFLNRFLPVLTAYVLGINRYLPSANPFKPAKSGAYLYYVANLMVQAQYEYGGQRFAVWNSESWPFIDKPNMNSGSVTPELQSLKDISDTEDSVVDGLLKSRQLSGQGRARWKEKDRTLGGLRTNQKESVYDNVKTYDSMTGQWSQQPRSSQPRGGYAGTSLSSYENYSQYANEQVNSSGSYEINIRDGGSGNYQSLKDAFPIEGLGKGTEFGGSLNGAEKERNIALLVAAAKQMGIDDPTPLLSMAQAESGFRWWVRTGMGIKDKRQSARGYYQFINSTWGSQMKKYAKEFGIPEGSTQTDPYANALLGAAFVRDNLALARKATGGKLPITPGMAYLYHMGNGVGNTIVRAMASNPNQSAAAAVRAVYPNDRIPENNPGYFFRDGKGGQERSVAEFMAVLNEKATTYTAARPGAVGKALEALPGTVTGSSEPAKAMGHPGETQTLPELSKEDIAEIDAETTPQAKQEVGPLPASANPSAAGAAGSAISKAIGGESEDTPATETVESTNKIPAPSATSSAPTPISRPSASPVHAPQIQQPNDTSLVKGNEFRDGKLTSIDSTLTQILEFMKANKGVSENRFGTTTKSQPVSIPQPNPTLNLSRG